jgi:hypothetical protein
LGIALLYLHKFMPFIILLSFASFAFASALRHRPKGLTLYLRYKAKAKVAIAKGYREYHYLLIYILLPSFKILILKLILK